HNPDEVHCSNKNGGRNAVREERSVGKCRETNQCNQGSADRDEDHLHQRYPIVRDFFLHSFTGSDPTFELTRRRESTHPPPHQASCERRPRRSRPTTDCVKTLTT